MQPVPLHPARLIDSHTGGEPTRVLVSGGPDLGSGPLPERLRRFRQHHDHWRRALVNEPRGNDVLVGALLCPPHQTDSDFAVIFFNNEGFLGMCGHGTIGVVATLAHLGLAKPGTHRIETPVGEVQATLHADGGVTVANVRSYRHAAQVAVQLPGVGLLHGDVAWGGNWFFLCHDHGLPVQAPHIPALTARAENLRQALAAQGITGAEGAFIDHIELLGPPQNPQHQGRSFVLCPGGAYDRSPCGTGTSAKLACLAADGALAPGQVWHQESVIGSVFAAHYKSAAGQDGVLPFIHGRAHLTLDASVLFDAHDACTWGLV